MIRKPKAKPKRRSSGDRASIGARLLELAWDLENEPMTYAELRRRYRISQPTAFRRIRDLNLLFGGAVTRTQDEQGTVRFSMPMGSSGRFAYFSEAEVVLLLESAKFFEASARPEDARRLRAMAQAVLDSMPVTRRRKVSVDAAALAEREGIAMRAGPRARLEPEIVSRIRQAILAQKTVEIDYDARISAGGLKTHRLEPHGLVFGHRNYLVAFFHGDKRRGPALFALSRIRRIVVEPSSFFFREGFDIDDFTRQSFGVWQGDTIDVAWRFSADRAADVMESFFHHTETRTVLADKSVEVRFRASGQSEMLYHLFTWEDAVTAIDPPALREAYLALLEKIRRKLAG